VILEYSLRLKQYIINMPSVFHSRCPAKINLLLLVESRLRSTGLHTLRSVFCRAGLTDFMRVEIFEGQVDDPPQMHSPFVCQEFETQKVFLSVRIIDELKRQLQKLGKLQIVENELNLPGNSILSAIKYFFDYRRERGLSEVERTFVITLNKAIPLEAGLGGGSANAASLLQILSRHLLSNDQSLLHEVAKKTGNDVLPCLYSSPVFYDGEHIVATGERGSALEVLIIKPEQGSSTKEAFLSLDRPFTDSPDRSTPFSEQDLKDFVGDFIKFETAFLNDFEKPVFEQLPILLLGKDVLMDHGASMAGMSGSGSSLVGVYKRGILDENIINSVRIALGEGWFIKNAEIYL
jgi:4-diphosphocytidyl-2C-methyl-D-erythritol kinase